MWQKLQARLEQRKAQDLLRQRLTIEGAQGVRIRAEGKEYLNFSSNDYLGLANHPKLNEAMQKAAKQYGAGSGASHLIIGHSDQHHALEQEIADFLGTERALLFSTGYMANYGVLTCLPEKNDLIIQDKLNHASLIDGGMASPAKMLRYAHADMDSFERQMKQPADTRLVVTDGVFSMDGDIAPLPELVSSCNAHKASLMIDDAHGFGVLGEQGKGSLEHFGLAQQSADIYMATLGKALGGFGAVVAGNELLIESLIQFGRSYIYTTAMPAAVAAANRAGLKLIQEESWRRQQLKMNIDYFRRLANEYDIPLMPSETAIQPVLIGRNDKTLAVSRALKEAGILLVAIRPPTVPENSARLRVTLTAEHSTDDIDYLLEQLSAEINKANQQK
ncbi:8-amino-7-oxononanoate synthase [Kangiella aquimarina]|uniref:8-amino-7-oxononanoate synthase n=1 Tax=Kangiella aquimarina TaxID=261965 RepID=A0ABZ0X686_9GAMM|nr:8-amino-7-oxononanoate synthase [Kangiella aquimarina]WQG86106.1 8-amino-7-oxononanoate synthase [Kangiella aquimarina]